MGTVIKYLSPALGPVPVPPAAPAPREPRVPSPYLAGILQLVEAASTDHARIEVWIEEDTFPAAVDGDFGLKEFVGGLVLIDAAPAGDHTLGARGEVAAPLGQWDGLDVLIESGL